MKKILFFMLFLPFIEGKAQSIKSESKAEYKKMMYDFSYNFYEVVKEGELYFTNIDKSKKGSGYKPFMRWVNENEYKYYPSGDRSNVDPYFAANQYKAFLKNNTSGKSLFNGSWKDLGPYTIDSITGHYSAGLGRVEDFYVSPVDANIIYLGSRSGGFWRTTDGGSSWTGTTNDLFASGVNAISVSPTNSDSVLINVRNASNGTSHGIYRSTDGGLSWSATPFVPQNLNAGGLGSNFQIYEIAYHPRIKDLVYVGTNQGLYQSTDNLATWTRNFSSYNIIEIAFHPTADSIAYFYNAANFSSAANLVIRTLDMGATFSASNAIIGNNRNTSVELATSPVCPDCIYFASNNGVWISRDKGLNFSFLSNSTESCGGFAVSDLDTNYMVYGYLDLDNSTSGGRSFVRQTRWSLGNTNGNTSSNASSYQTSSNYIHADVRNLKSVNGVFYAATDGFLCKSTDNGVNWEILSEGVGIRENYKLGLSQSNHDFSVSGSQDNGTSILTENGWVEFYGADGMEALVHPLNDKWLIGSVQFGNRIRSKDRGLTQTGVKPSGSNDAYWEAPLAYDPNDHMRLYDFRDRVYRSDDFSDSHVQLANPSSLNGDIQHAAIAHNNSDIIVVARGNAIEKSVDGGVSFTSIKNNLPNYSIRNLTFDPNDDDVMIVVYANYQSNNQKVFRTTNGGLSWSNITYNLGSMPILSVVIDHTPASNIYLGAEIGVFTMPMGGSSWLLYNAGLPNVAVKELEINYGSNTLKAATWGRGLWEYNLVGRADYPAIVSTSIPSEPTLAKPKIGVDQWVTSKIHYTGNLSAVYLEWSQDSAVFGNRINMSNTVDSTWVSNQPLPQLSVGTKLYFKVFAVGANNDTTETFKFMYEVQPFDYCSATGNSSSGNLFINNVSLSNFQNSSGNNAYNYYSQSFIELYADSSYLMIVSANTSWLNNDFTAWIDYNGNAEFEESEKVISNSNMGSNGFGVFTVPSTINVNDTIRMRVRLSYWANGGNSCGDEFGEVEDYNIVLRDISTSIQEIKKQASGILIYPNPNTGNFSAVLNEKFSNETIKIYDQQGKLIAEKAINGKQKVDFNLNLASGQYIIVSGSGENRQSAGFIIEN